MKDPMDPRVDLLVAALYGELDTEELARFEKQLEADPVLRAEWEELRSTRSLLTAWELEEKVPSFVLVDSERAKQAVRAVPSGTRWWDVFKRPLPAAGWVFAAAAVILAILAVSQARIDLLDRGIAFRFGPPTQAELQAPAVEPQGGVDAPAKSTPIETSAPSLAESQIGGPVPTISQVSENPVRNDWVVPRSDSLEVRLGSQSDFASSDRPMTLKEFEAYTAGMSKVVAAMQAQNEYNLRQSEEFLGFVRSMYEGLSEKQADDYYELRGRIESVRYGLTEVETTTNDRFDSIDLRPGEPLSPGVTPTGTEKKENEDE